MENLYQIGKVAKELKITTRAIRFYIDKGLLNYAEKSKASYRFFDESQINRLKKILFLKDLNFSLEEIREYFDLDDLARKQFLLKKQRDLKINLASFQKIIDKQLYDLSFLEDKLYYGNKVRIKRLTEVVGVWKLFGIYKNIKNAKNDVENLKYFTPYKFLAFNVDGTSPWFYYATDKKIIFNTYFLPVAELYQVVDDKLYVSITNAKDHAFINKEKCLNKSHILVFEKFSNSFEDYKKLTYSDVLPTKVEHDKRLFGVYKKVGTKQSLDDEIETISSNEILIFYNYGVVEKYQENAYQKLNWTKDMIFDKSKSITYRFWQNKDELVVENKTNIYVFTGEIKNYCVYKKIDFKVDN